MTIKIMPTDLRRTKRVKERGETVFSSFHLCIGRETRGKGTRREGVVSQVLMPLPPHVMTRREIGFVDCNKESVPPASLLEKPLLTSSLLQLFFSFLPQQAFVRRSSFLNIVMSCLPRFFKTVNQVGTDIFPLEELHTNSNDNIPT